MIQFIEHVRIDVSQIVARHKQTDEAFKRLYWDMQDRFGDRQYGYRVCLHEAAHAILMEQSGIKNVRFSGPAILFDLEKNPKTGFFPIVAMASGDDTRVNAACAAVRESPSKPYGSPAKNRTAGSRRSCWRRCGRSSFSRRLWPAASAGAPPSE